MTVSHGTAAAAAATTTTVPAKTRRLEGRGLTSSACVKRSVMTRLSEQGSRHRSFCETERVGGVNVQPPLSAEGLLERRACLTNTCLHTFLERLVTPQSGNPTFNRHLMSQVEQKVPWLCVDCESGQPMATLRLLAVCYPKSNRKSCVFVLTRTRDNNWQLYIEWLFDISSRAQSLVVLC